MLIIFEGTSLAVLLRLVSSPQAQVILSLYPLEELGIQAFTTMSNFKYLQIFNEVL
jgi:hypothetical protein